MPLTKKQVAELRRTKATDSGNRVGIALQMLEVSQNAAAEASGLPQQYVNDIVTGRYRTTSVDKAQKLADYVGCYIEDLFPSSEAVAS